MTVNRVLFVYIMIFVVGATIAYFRTRRKRARMFYRRRLEQALSDGVLTAEEYAELDDLREEHDLSQAETRMVALSIYRRALRDALADHHLSAEEDAALQRLQAQLGLRSVDLRADATQLSRVRMLSNIANGKLPTVDSPIALGGDEIAHWVVQGTLAEKLALPTPDAAPRGTTFDVLGNAAFDAAAERDPLRPSAEIMPLDLGIMLITNRRVLFQGAKRTLSIPHARLRAVTLFSDGVRLDESASADGVRGAGVTRRFFLVQDAELTAAMALQAARGRNRELEPATRPTRSA